MDAELFAGFYRRYYRLVLTMAQRRLADFDAAQDVTASVFRIAWEYHLSGKELTLPWLYQTLRNVVGNEYRHQTRSDALFTKLAPMYCESIPPEPVDEQLTVREAMRQLSPNEYDLLCMAYWEDLSASEIGDILGCSATAVRVRLMRARTHMKSILTKPVISEETPPLTKVVTSNAINNQVQNQSRSPRYRQPEYAPHSPR